MNEKTNQNESSCNINCNIIRDLLPSYVDGICSADSNEAVERHLTSCADCKKLLGALREAEVLEQRRETEQISYMKKIKKYTNKKEAIGFGILLASIIFSLWVFSGQSFRGLPLFYLAILPLVLFDTHYLLTDHMAFAGRTESKTILTLVSSLLLCLGVFLAFASIGWVKRQNFPFGIQDADIGKFLHSIYLFLALCQLAIFIAGIVLTRKTSNSYGIVISVSATGFFLMFYTLSVFQTLSDYEMSMKALLQSLYILLEGGCITVLAEVVQSKKRRGDLA